RQSVGSQYDSHDHSKMPPLGAYPRSGVFKWLVEWGCICRNSAAIQTLAVINTLIIILFQACREIAGKTIQGITETIPGDPPGEKPLSCGMMSEGLRMRGSGSPIDIGT